MPQSDNAVMFENGGVSFEVLKVLNMSEGFLAIWWRILDTEVRVAVVLGLLCSICTTDGLLAHELFDVRSQLDSMRGSLYWFEFRELKGLWSNMKIMLMGSLTLMCDEQSFVQVDFLLDMDVCICKVCGLEGLMVQTMKVNEDGAYRPYIIMGVLDPLVGKRSISDDGLMYGKLLTSLHFFLKQTMYVLEVSTASGLIHWQLWEIGGVILSPGVLRNDLMKFGLLNIHHGLDGMVNWDVMLDSTRNLELDFIIVEPSVVHLEMNAAGNSFSVRNVNPKRGIVAVLISCSEVSNSDILVKFQVMLLIVLWNFGRGIRSTWMSLRSSKLLSSLVLKFDIRGVESTITIDGSCQQKGKEFIMLPCNSEMSGDDWYHMYHVLVASFVNVMEETNGLVYTTHQSCGSGSGAGINFLTLITEVEMLSTQQGLIDVAQQRGFYRCVDEDQLVAGVYQGRDVMVNARGLVQWDIYTLLIDKKVGLLSGRSMRDVLPFWHSFLVS